MKALLRKLRRLLSMGGVVAALTAGAATNSVPTAAVSGTAAPDVAPTPLKVRVNSPASWGMLVDGRLDVAFTKQLHAILNEMGFAAPVEPISVIENPDTTPYLLTLNLTEWRIDRSSRVSCVFDATLQTQQGARYLGIYTQSALRW